jgi:hypothetical protein
MRIGLSADSPPQSARISDRHNANKQRGKLRCEFETIEVLVFIVFPISYFLSFCCRRLLDARNSIGTYGVANDAMLCT